MVRRNIAEKIEIPNGLQGELDKKVLKLKGPKGEIARKFSAKKIKMTLENNQIQITSEKPTKKEKTMVNTFKAHIKNMIKGVSKGYTYKLKVCSGHFPITVSVEGQEVVIKNFMGEKVPRRAKIIPNVKVQIAGDEITIESVNKEDAGQTASNIELATRITNRDRRVFQDGVYITEKAMLHDE